VTIQDTFEVIYQDSTVQIERVTVAGQMLYKAVFADRPPLFIHQATDSRGNFFWTSVPEGRQHVAHEIGTLINVHLKPD
jgi:hypothetical protein